MNRVTRIAVLFCSLLAGATWAQGVPTQLSFTANLTNSGAPVTGNHIFTFSLFPTANSTTASWTETQNAVPVNNGMVFTTLGAVNTLNSTILNGTTLYLEVTIDTATTLAPRTPIVSVPYAVRAGVASNADAVGGLVSTDLQRRVTGLCSGSNAVQTIDATGNVTCVAVGTGDITGITTSAGSGLTGGVASGNATLALDSSGCTASGQVLKWTGSTWTCQNDTSSGGTVTSIVAGSGLTGGTITGTGTIAIGTAGVTNAMLANNSLTITPNAGLTGGGSVALGGTTTVGLTACAANQILKVSSSGAWACGVDVDTNTTYTTTAPISLSGTALGLTACGANQIYKMGANGWACAADNDTLYTDAQAVAAVTAQTVSHTMSYGPTDFAMAPSTVALNCVLPQANCATPVGITNTLYLPLRIPGPSTLTSLSCLVQDNDVNGNISMAVHNGNLLQGTVYTVGAAAGSQVMTLNLSAAQNINSRGPTAVLGFFSSAGQPSMYVYTCWATYDTNGL